MCFLPHTCQAMGLIVSSSLTEITGMVAEPEDATTECDKITECETIVAEHRERVTALRRGYNKLLAMTGKIKEGIKDLAKGLASELASGMASAVVNGGKSYPLSRRYRFSRLIYDRSTYVNVYRFLMVWVTFTEEEILVSLDIGMQGTIKLSYDPEILMDCVITD
jgi:hypothetical protein